jgi:hypothetical protein
MFKGFKNTKAGPNFHGFPAKGFNMGQSAYGFSGVHAWLDASYGLNTNVDLAGVSFWIDRVSGINFAQTTAGSQPRYRSSDGNFNGHPVVDFHDASRTLSVPSGGIPVSNSTTLALVAQKVTDGGGRNCIFATSSVVDLGNIRFGMGTSLSSGIGVYNGDTVLMQSGVNDTSPHIIVFSTGASGNARIIVDGVQVATGTWTFSTIWKAIGVTSGSVLGIIAEAIVYDSSMTQEQAIELSDTLNTKYAIY